MKKRMNSRQLSRFYEHLATLLNSGLTIEKGLDVVKEGKKGPFLWMLDGIRHHVMQGGTFWEGMSRYPKYFDDFQAMIVKGAEESGMMVDTARRLAKYYESRYRAKRRFMVSLIYPLLLLHAAILLPPLKYLVVESLGRSYVSVVLPPLAIGYGFVGLVYLFWHKLCRYGPLRHMSDEGSLCIPFIGGLVRDMSVTRAFWALSAMLTAGMEAVTAAKNAAAAAGNSVVSQRLEGALYVLEGGRSFKEYFAVSGILTNDQLTTVAVGEESGQLAESLARLVRQMEESNAHRFHMLMKIIGLAVYFIAAGIVAFTVLSFYIGYFNF